jgi:cytidylate kinase
LDGRDVGTVVCPDAEVKLFVTASDEARARRRHLELEARGGSPGYDEVLEDLRRRDRRDRTRANSPLVRAPDADLLETTDLGIEAAFQAALRLIAAR